MNDEEEPKLKIYLNTNAKMSRGKYAAHAVHAALLAAGVHPNIPVVVLGAKPKDILNMRTHVRDAGHTELEPGTVTAGTDWYPRGTGRRRRAAYDKWRNGRQFEKEPPTADEERAWENGWMAFEMAEYDESRDLREGIEGHDR